MNGSPLAVLVVCAALNAAHACNVNTYYNDPTIAAIVDGTSTLSRAQKRSAMGDLVKAGATSIPYTSSSTDVWDAMERLDEDPNNSNNIITIYKQSSVPKSDKSSGTGWNREHTWPRSFDVFDSGADFTDVHAIRPSDWQVNSARSNKYYATCPPSGAGVTRPGHPEAPDTASCFNNDAWEAPANVRGDLARGIFFMAIRYDGQASNLGDLDLSDCPCDDHGFFGLLTELIAWHYADPPTTAEVQRNNDICNLYQNNRNPFIDHPHLVNALWLAPASCVCQVCSTGNDAQCTPPPGATPSPTQSLTGGPNPTTEPTTAAPTVFVPCGRAPGSILVIGMTGIGGSSLAFVTLVDLPAGEEFFFDDNVFDGSDMLTGEGRLRYTVPSAGLSAGAVTVYDGTGSDWTPEFDGGFFDLGTTEDSLIVYQECQLGKVYIHAATYAIGGFVPPSQVSGGGATTALPMGLNATLQNVELSTGGYHIYNGVTTGTSQELKALVNDAAEWLSSGSSGTDFSTVFAAGFTVNPIPPSAAPTSTPTTLAPTTDPTTPPPSAEPTTQSPTVTPPSTAPSTTPPSITPSTPPTGAPTKDPTTAAPTMTPPSTSPTETPECGLPPGSILILGATSSPDQVAFMTLVDIVQGEKIFFTDKGWDNSTGDGFRDPEGVLGYEASAGGMQAGDIAVYPGSSEWSPIFQGGFFDLATTGDSLLAYQECPGGNKFIHGITYDAGGWVSPAQVTDDSASALPAELQSSGMEVELTALGHHYYNGISTGLAVQFQSNVNSAANWVSSATSPGDFNVIFPASFTVLPPTPTQVPVPEPSAAPSISAALSMGLRAEVAKLVGNDTVTRDNFGYRVDIDGSVAIIGAYLADVGGLSDAGAAHIYKTLDSVNWFEQQKLTETAHPAADNQFGYDVAIDATNLRAIVGARFNSYVMNNAGAATIFSFNGIDWLGQEVTASPVRAQDQFGYAVDITAEYAIVGAPLRNNGIDNAGAAYIFKLDASSNVVSTIEVEASDRAAKDNFGEGVGIDGCIAAVGSPLDNQPGNSGSIYVYATSNSGATWPEITRLDAGAEKSTGDELGTRVAVSGGVIIGGARLRDDFGDRSGAAYIFTSPDGGFTWPTTVRINAVDPELLAQFGADVDVDGDLIIVGANFDDETAGNSGVAYLYRGSGVNMETWVFEAKLSSSSSSQGDQEGFAVAITAGAAIVGAPREDDNGVISSGAAYIYDTSV